MASSVLETRQPILILVSDRNSYGGERQIGGRRSAADAGRRVELRAMAGAEPAVVVALIAERDAAEVGAVAVDHQPLVVAGLDALLVGHRVRQALPVDGARLLDFLLGAIAHEDRFAAPEYLDDLPLRDRREVDLDRRAGRDGGDVGIHLRDQRPRRRGDADRADGSGRDIEEIAACRLGRRHGRHVVKSFPSSRSAHRRWIRRPACAWQRPTAAREPARRRLSGRGDAIRRSSYWHPCEKSARADRDDGHVSHNPFAQCDVLVLSRA